MTLLRFYRAPALSAGAVRDLLDRARSVSSGIAAIETEYCFYADCGRELGASEIDTLAWLLAETFDPGGFSRESLLSGDGTVLEVGPRMNFSTAWSTNAVSVLKGCGIWQIHRVERSRRYLLRGIPLSSEEQNRFLALVHDRMTECPYPGPLDSFSIQVKPGSVFTVPVLEEGRSALEKINREMGLGFDDRDLDFYTDLFRNDIGRNPTSVECFDLGQSNSEHSRHWFFTGRLTVDGQPVSDTLLDIVRKPYRANPNNSVIAFKDNASAIRGGRVETIQPALPGRPSPFVTATRDYHVTFTAETHNFPSGVAPFPGAETGTGGRIRDVQAVGTGGLVLGGTAAYCVGNLRIPGYPLPWEDAHFVYPPNLAPPLRIEIEASNGASDYGNKFGEPLIQGFTRSFGLKLPGGERREWLKPIMFTGGIGQLDARHVTKGDPEPGMLVVKVGGPAYRIGMGGGAASSMIQGENVAELDFNAVQRGDAEMEQKMNRVIRACAEMGDANPIVSLHDQGAGGNCNVVKEIIYPAGATIEVREVLLGDATLSVLEIWGAEYQENDALLIRPEHADLFAGLCAREKVPFSYIGTITGDGRVVLHDRLDGSTPVDLDLEKVLGDMPPKTFVLERIAAPASPLLLPEGLSVLEALDRVLRLVSVGSKRFLTSKVDRSVTGLIARQQCAGPLQLTVADTAVIAQSHFGLTGAAIAIGEQPIVGLLSPAAMARMTVAEALTNIVWANTTGLGDIRCSANWMWAAKLPGEGAALYDAAVAMSDMMTALGIAVDGGKDSLSMAAQISHGNGTRETVKSPGTLVVSAYVTVKDIRKTVTPDIKRPGESSLLFIDLSGGKLRLGASALAHCWGQIGDTPPDMEDPGLLARTFELVQELIEEGRILAGHDRSDGGLVTALLEMAFAGNCGVSVDINRNPAEHLAALFAEESGLLMEVPTPEVQSMLSRMDNARVPCELMGHTRPERRIDIRLRGVTVLDEPMAVLRDIWESTSFALEKFQTDGALAEEERAAVRERSGPAFHAPFLPEPTPSDLLAAAVKPKVAIVREEGSNGDREMTSAFYLAGFEPWDVTVTDLAEDRVRLSDFRGVVFVGGFSYADVLDSAKGWAGVIRFNERVRSSFQDFFARPDTFSLGICNGCQLMALLGWVPLGGIADPAQPRFVHNGSGRFESRFATVRILPSPAIMLTGMEGSVLGVWVAHGEGRAYFPDENVYRTVLAENLAPVRYADDDGKPTERYPFNPNGSPMGITALCSRDGRHLAMMPHPERAILPWQWGWMPETWTAAMHVAPWLRMFQNARTWCESSIPRR